MAVSAQDGRLFSHGIKSKSSQPLCNLAYGCLPHIVRPGHSWPDETQSRKDSMHPASMLDRTHSHLITTWGIASNIKPVIHGQS